MEIAVVAGAAALILYFIPRHLGGSFASWLVPAVLLYAPIGAIIITDRDFDGCGLRLPSSGAGRDLAIFALGVMPIFIVGFLVFAVFWWHRQINAAAGGFSVEAMVWQLLGVALPEEVFFRGWLQGRLNRSLSARVRILGARVGPGLFIAAALFAVFHLLVRPAPSRLLVFFPGLLFGLFRERTKSVAVPVLAHALANLLFLVAQEWVAG
jgi:membrane protease YdiL (CAAX protease family)